RARRRGGASRQGRYRARRRKDVSRSRRRTHPVLRRRIPLGTRGRQPAENGLSQRDFDGRRLEGLEGRGAAERDVVSLIATEKKPAGCNRRAVIGASNGRVD